MELAGRPATLMPVTPLLSSPRLLDETCLHCFVAAELMIGSIELDNLSTSRLVCCSSAKLLDGSHNNRTNVALVEQQGAERERDRCTGTTVVKVVPSVGFRGARSTGLDCVALSACPIGLNSITPSLADLEQQ